jgi:hypothetical protein
MTYDLLFSDQAEAVLVRLPVHVLNVVEQELDKLAENPVALGRPVVSPPYPPGGQMYYFKHKEVDGIVHHFTILFHYGLDEKTLQITGISYQFNE